jgi:hypothetical protein
MNRRNVCKWCMLAALAALGANFGLHKAVAVPPLPVAKELVGRTLVRPATKSGSHLEPNPNPYGELL